MLSERWTSGWLIERRPPARARAAAGGDPAAGGPRRPGGRRRARHPGQELQLAALVRIKLRNRGQKVVKATVIVNGKRVKVLRGKRLTSRVDLRGLPKGRFSVRIELLLADGKTISGVRRYYTCRPGRKERPAEGLMRPRPAG